MGKLLYYQDLIVWQKSIQLVGKIYEVTQSFPKHEQFGLTSQIRRSAVSISANIAEGQARNGTKEFIYHLGVSLGSLAELETEVIIAFNLGFLQSKEEILQSCAEIGRMLHGLIKSLN